jgi:O-antigen/teichoic acid export membrane protein
MDSPASLSGRTYFSNIAWSWVGFASILLSSAIVMPILIRRLGTAQYGIWALAVSLVEYFWMIDVGFRPATVKLSAEYLALNRMSEVNDLVNTALAYSLSAGAVVLLFGWMNVDRIGAILHVVDPSFAFVLRVVALSWAAGLVFNVFAAVLDGFQRFDLSSRATIVGMTARAALNVLVVLGGYGLREMAIVLLVSQATSYAMTYVYCRRVYADMRLSPAYVRVDAAREIVVYARQLVAGVIGSRFAQGGVPTAIAYFKPLQFVTYFTQTQRLLEYAADGISRVALVTAPRITDAYARGHRQQIVELARDANRYCLTLWGFFAAFLVVYGGPLCRVWINEEFGNQAAVLLPLLVTGYTFWIGQFISAAVLMSIGRYTAFSLTLFAESVVVVGGVALAVPRFGLVGAAAVFSAAMIVSRTLVLSRLFAREFAVRQWVFLRAVYTRPLMLIAASITWLWASREWLLPGRSWRELIGVGLVHGMVYVPLALWLVVEPEHRQYLWLKAAGFLRRSPALDPRQPMG